MTTQQLSNRIRIGSLVSYGHHEIKITYRNKCYKCTTTNTIAIDSVIFDNEKQFYYTKKQALQALYDECKEKNNLK